MLLLFTMQPFRLRHAVFFPKSYLVMAFHVGKWAPHSVTELAVDHVPHLAMLSPRLCVLTPTPLPPPQYKYASPTKQLDDQGRTGSFHSQHAGLTTLVACPDPISVLNLSRGRDIDRKVWRDRDYILVSDQPGAGEVCWQASFCGIKRHALWLMGVQSSQQAQPSQLCISFIRLQMTIEIFWRNSKQLSPQVPRFVKSAGSQGSSRLRGFTILFA